MTTMTSIEIAPEGFFGENTEAKLAVAFLLDCSGSMAGPPIKQVKEGLQSFADFIASNPIARNRVEVTLVSYGRQVTVHCENVSPDALQIPTFKADGDTPMGEAILTGLEIVEARKRYYKDNAIDYVKPLAINLTDGQPTDTATFTEATEELLLAEAQDKVSFYCFGCNGADLTMMANMGTKHEPVLLETANIKKFFQKVSMVVSRFLDEDGQLDESSLTEDFQR